MSDSHEESIVHERLDVDRQEPAVQVAEIVASLDGKDQTELSPVYDQIDHVLTHIFSNPPDPGAQVEISFTYEGYRITVEQNGRARFVDVT